MEAQNVRRHNRDMAHVKPPKSAELKVLVAARMKAAVDAYHSTRAEVARRLDITPQQLSAALNARNYPDEAFVVKLCELTGCTADWIYRGVMKSEMPVDLAVHIAMEHPELVKQEQPDSARFPASAES